MKFTLKRWSAPLIIAALLGWLIGSALGIIAPHPANAADEPQPGDTITLRWVLPDGGTPDNVTWPQPEYTGQVPLCGESFWLQVDTGPYDTAESIAWADRLNDDGILTNGEDHGWVKSWTFEQVFGPECAPQPEPAVEFGEASSLDCEIGIVTTTYETRVTGEPTFDQLTNTWTLGPWGEWTEAQPPTQREATAEECPPVVVPPVEPPVEECPELTAEDGSCVPANFYEEPEPEAIVTTYSGDELAATGARETTFVIAAALTGLAALGGGIWMLIAAHKRQGTGIQ